MANVKDFGAKGDGCADDAAAVQRAVAEGDGLLFFPRGTYCISRPIEIDLSQCGRIGVSGAQGCATLVMTGPGPALSLAGSHEGTAGPETLTPQVLGHERMPLVDGLEIAGAHPEADGVRLHGLWQPTLTRLYVRECRHGIHVVRRNRNLIIAECHLHNNRGVGVFYDHVDLHQSNIYGSHISYNKGGGVKVLESGIRNLQISSNDIEYNCAPNAPESADVWIETLSSSVREGTIVGNTIQAVPSPNGANVRFRGLDDEVRTKAGHWAVTGNLISNQMVNVHLQYARGIVISGNSFFSGREHALRVEQSDCIVVGPNSIDRNPDYRVETGGGVLFDRCSGCVMSGTLLVAARAAGAAPQAALEVLASRDVGISGCQILDPAPCGVRLHHSENCRVADCTILDRTKGGAMTHAIHISGGRNNLISNNLLGGAAKDALSCDDHAAVLNGNAVTQQQ